eukprot:1887616-Rhodomonas_salina.1
MIFGGIKAAFWRHACNARLLCVVAAGGPVRNARGSAAAAAPQVEAFGPRGRRQLPKRPPRPVVPAVRRVQLPQLFARDVDPGTDGVRGRGGRVGPSQ